MGLLNEALTLLGLTADWDASAGRHELSVPKTRAEQRELAEAIRRIPGRYGNRLSARAREQVTAAAGAGQWEEAIDHLITALRARAETITVGEGEELRDVLEALNMPADCLDALLVNHSVTSHCTTGRTTCRPPQRNPTLRLGKVRFRGRSPGLKRRRKGPGSADISSPSVTTQGSNWGNTPPSREAPFL